MAGRGSSNKFFSQNMEIHGRHQRSFLSSSSSTNVGSRLDSQRNVLRSQQYGSGVSVYGQKNFSQTRQRFPSYYPRSRSNSLLSISDNDSGVSFVTEDFESNNSSLSSQRDQSATFSDETVTLQISNLDTSFDDVALTQYLKNKLQSITPILSFTFEGITVKVTLPSEYSARLVIANLHRKKFGHKRLAISRTKDSSLLDPLTLQCQVVGLLKEHPSYCLSVFKFRELFQGRFKTSININDLYAMTDICTITENGSEKNISLRSDVIESIERSDFRDALLYSVPFCSIHYQSGGWAEQDIEPLPNVFWTLADVKKIVCSAIEKHNGSLPVASLMHCIQSDFDVQTDDNGINLEHLISCVNEIIITTNKFGIKILNKRMNGESAKDFQNDLPLSSGRFMKNANLPDPNEILSPEVVELLKSHSKCTMKFSRFIPAYHNYFKRQCRVADYGYTKLQELFEAIPHTVQIMGEGENRLITLTHECQKKRFVTDLLRILRVQHNKSICLSQLDEAYQSIIQKNFDITDYGVCNIKDMIFDLSDCGGILVEQVPQSDDILFSFAKRRSSGQDMQKISIFATEVTKLLQLTPQYTIHFEKFACHYNFHFGYQFRLIDHGYPKLADLMDAIAGIVEVDHSNEEDRKIYLSPKVAQRIFSQQLKEISREINGSRPAYISIHDVFTHHMRKYGYKIKPQILGFQDDYSANKSLPYVEVIQDNYIICHHDDDHYKAISHLVILLILTSGKRCLSINELMELYLMQYREELTESLIQSMNHFLDFYVENNCKMLSLSALSLFILQIIKVLEQDHSITLSSLGLKLNISPDQCFQIGYPSLISLIESFADIFTMQSLSVQDDAIELTLNKQCAFVSCKINEIPLPNNRSFGVYPKRPLAQKRSLNSFHGLKTRSQNIARGQFCESMNFQQNTFYIPQNNQLFGKVYENDRQMRSHRANIHNEISRNDWTNKENMKFVEHNQENNEYTSKMLRRGFLKRPSSNDGFENTIPPKRLLPYSLNLAEQEKESDADVPFWMDPVWHTSPERSVSGLALISRQETVKDDVDDSQPRVTIKSPEFTINIPVLKTFPSNQINLDTPTILDGIRNNIAKFNFDFK